MSRYVLDTDICIYDVPAKSHKAKVLENNELLDSLFLLTTDE